MGVEQLLVVQYVAGLVAEWCCYGRVCVRASWLAVWLLVAFLAGCWRLAVVTGAENWHIGRTIGTARRRSHKNFDLARLSERSETYPLSSG